VQPGQRVAPGLFVDVGIDLKRRADPGVTENGLSVAGRDAQIFQERGDHMPEVVDLDRPELAAVTDAAEGPDEVARLDGPPGPGGEH
jgi:hypothetical protein